MVGFTLANLGGELSTEEKLLSKAQSSSVLPSIKFLAISQF